MAGKQIGSPRAATREMMLRQQITSLEHELHPPSRAFGSTRPLSARGDSAAPSPRPRSTLGSPRVNSARPRKAQSDIRAYQAAGLTAQAHWPSPTITALIESSRGAPKAEEPAPVTTEVLIDPDVPPNALNPDPTRNPLLNPLLCVQPRRPTMLRNLCTCELG